MYFAKIKNRMAKMCCSSFSSSSSSSGTTALLFESLSLFSYILPFNSVM